MDRSYRVSVWVMALLLAACAAQPVRTTTTVAGEPVCQDVYKAVAAETAVPPTTAKKPVKKSRAR